MLTAEAEIETERPSRYLLQICKHASSMAGTRCHRLRAHSAVDDSMAHRQVAVHAEWSDTRGVLRFDAWGQCTITADADMLKLRVASPDDDSLRKIQDVLTRDLDRFGRREGLTVNWHQVEAPSDGSAACQSPSSIGRR